MRLTASVAAALAALAAQGCAPKAQPASPGAAASAEVAPPPVVAAPSPLRRLTSEEYNNAVRDLLGDSSRPADGFPPDEVVGGFENNTISPVNQTLVERYMSAAEAVAASAAARVDKVAPCPQGEQPEACARRFIDSFGRLAFRRPLEEGERAALLSLYGYKQKSAGHARGVQIVIEAVLQSPKFLYRLEPADSKGSKTRPLTGYELATRLSFFLWASTPDAQLLDEAGAGKLATAADVERAARRMVRDPRAADGLKNFHRQWLDLREIETASKDPALYPSFTPELRRAMVEETLRFGAHAVGEGGDVVATLLTSKKSFVNGALARIYGVPAPAGDGFALVSLPSSERSGLLTQASVMTVHASADQTSPILRGKFVRERLLCQPVPPPPPNVPAAPKFDPKLTKKEQFARHQADPSCGGCHKMMDPIGFGFEHYDAVGAWRTVEGPLKVDSEGDLSGTDADGAFDGALALGERLSKSQQVRRCVSTQWFRAALGRVERDEDETSMNKAFQLFEKAGFDVRELLIAVVTSDSFRHAGLDEGDAP